ncbi:MAG: hypothetical protein K0R02_213 [Rickettsiaceae bacterium]|jgi:hypothetical protein|nr:hypothetical protein [Rickettsiaceae bacterium]
MELITIARAIFALILVIFLIILSIGLYNRFLQNNKYIAKLIRRKNLRISESIIIDQHNKVIELSRKNKKHLILIGKNSEILLDTYEDLENEELS